MRLLLKRDFDDGSCSLGKLSLHDLLGNVLWSCETIERPWIGGVVGGQPGRSCVPIGSYKLEKHDSEAHPRTWALVNHDVGVAHFPTAGVPRAACLIHPANFAFELRGCIAPGEARLKADNWQVLRSRLAFSKLRELLPWEDGHVLEIT